MFRLQNNNSYMHFKYLTANIDYQAKKKRNPVNIIIFLFFSLKTCNRYLHLQKRMLLVILLKLKKFFTFPITTPVMFSLINDHSPPCTSSNIFSRQLISIIFIPNTNSLFEITSTLSLLRALWLDPLHSTTKMLLHLLQYRYYH